MSNPVTQNPVTARTESGGFRTVIDASGHALLADEPASLGGTGTGPTPYDLLSSALASCTTMTLQMYARRKDIELTAVEVRVSHSRIHASDCENCETTVGYIDRFDRTISLEGTLSESEIERLIAIADKCPVHRTLTGEVEILTRRV